jgi:hypothetical protein
MDSEGGNAGPGQPPYGDPYSQPGSPPPPPPPYSQPPGGTPPPPPYSQPPGGTPPPSPYSQPPGGNPPPPPYSQPPGGTPTSPPYAQPGGAPDPYSQPGTPPPYTPPGPEQAGAPWSYQAPQAPGAPPAPGFGAPPYTPAAGSRGPNKRTLTIAGAAVAVVVVIIVIVVAVGGGSGNQPTDTVNGFIQASLSNNGRAVCSYFLPADQAACDASASALKGASGSVKSDSQVIQGNEALVSVTGRICAPYISGGSSSTGGTDCASNSDPSTGMPGNGVSFDQAYAAATSESNNSLSPVPLELVNGKWYLNSGS